MLSYTFMQRALVEVLMLSLGLGLLTILVNLRDLGVLGTGIGHAAFTGGVLGAIFGMPWLWMVATGMVVALLSQRIEGKRVSSSNSVIVAFTFILALGLILSYFIPEQVSTVMGLLFGSMVGVDITDLALTAIGTAAIAVFFFSRYWDILSTTFDEEYASVSGIAAGSIRLIISVLLAFYITVTIRAVGTLMVEALLVLPGAVSLQLTDSYHTSWKISTIIIGLSGLLALASAFFWNLPVSPLMVLFLSVLFLISRFVHRHNV
ncbi:metal ABC transporter permease [Coprothermobacter platensis]|uniref:metal ABC transporter permease n=1 Tax=Coprothermobacter platensis TaxID=108819 RepID=UPI000377F6A4|nr:metal ABC transporter permease [Coprothermobacter platensis]